MLKKHGIIPFFWYLASILSCGKHESSPDGKAISSHFSLGRRIARAIPSGADDGGLLLSGWTKEPSLVGFKEDPHSNIVLWALYNTDLTRKIPVQDLELDAKSLLEKEFESFQIDIKDLSEKGRIVSISDRLISVSFFRSWQGIPVRDATVEFIYLKQGEETYSLREVVNASHGPLKVENIDGAAPEWNDIVTNLRPQNLALISQRKVILPQREISGTIRFSLASEFLAKDLQTDITFVFSVEHATQKILEAYENLYHAAPKPLEASVYKRTYLDPERSFKPLRLVQVVSGNSQLRSDIDGNIDLEGLANATLRLSSDRGQINLAQANTAFQVSVPVVSGNSYTVTPAGDGLTALNTYAALLEINSFVRRNILPSEAPILGRGTVTRINVRGSCNAFYDPQISSISLFLAGNGCANVGLINDVIYHEWGHGLDNFTGKTPGITDGAFSEGIGDILSAYMTRSNNLAPGFLVNDPTGIRNLDNSARYPDNQGEVHVEGQIIGGAFWDMRKGLVERYGAVAGAAKAETIFLRHLLTTDTYLDSYQAAIRLDDDDGNPVTPSPNYCLINAAFAKHGLAQSENCQDKPNNNSLPTDETISAGIIKADESGITLMASSAKAALMGICIGSQKECLSNASRIRNLQREGTLNGKTTFILDQALKISPLQTITFIGQDASGKPIGARAVRLILK